ncbi:MAG TPA: hypothetical protein VGR32_13290 [Brevundimonas sp.]|jgi:hypothetical protein|uniref:hypothetical protein n=1 Tax=Brevundimonas sp. TaxID=1871086 RepID=UPI002DE37ECA|nr:hypothetical protein [Brevundimonas sp.]
MSPSRRAERSSLRLIKGAQETAHAAHEVVVARLALARSGRLNVDEAALMGMEKLQALGEGAADAGRILSAAGDRAARDATQEAKLALDAWTRASTDPSGAVAVQAAWLMGGWLRAADAATAFTASMLEAQAAALEPVRRVAVANAKRLKR